MTLDTLFNFIFNINIWIIAKVLVCFSLLIYLVFAGIMVRQVNLMTESIKLGWDWVLKIVALMHLLVAILVFLSALFIL